MILRFLMHSYKIKDIKKLRISKHSWYRHNWKTVWSKSSLSSFVSQNQNKFFSGNALAKLFESSHYYGFSMELTVILICSRQNWWCECNRRFCSMVYESTPHNPKGLASVARVIGRFGSYGKSICSLVITDFAFLLRIVHSIWNGYFFGEAYLTDKGSYRHLV